jgi:hypothetical protein
MTRRGAWAIIAWCAFLLVSTASCGRKTAPLTPPSPRVEAVQDVKVEARDNVAFLSWAIPTTNIEGKPIKGSDVLGFRIYRAEPGDQKRSRYRQVAEIDLSHPEPAEVWSGRVVWSDPNLHYGQTYAYRIRVISAHGGLSEPSEEVKTTPLLSLAAPKSVTATGGDSKISIAWTVVATRADGSPFEGFVGYNIYRGTEAGRENETPLNREPLTTTTYLDRSVINDRTYFYRVRSVDSPARPWKESLDSPEASAMSRDLTPPGPPTGLTVVPGVGRIFLTWNENTESDLAGYYVYRSRKSGRNYERLTNKPLERTTYSDERVKPGVVYYYVVSAVDRSGNESAFSKQQKAYAEKHR